MSRNYIQNEKHGPYFEVSAIQFFRVNSLKELFDTVEPVKIFSFLKEIGIYNKI